MEKQFKYERKINYYETDKMGVVHHSNYIRFLEEARSRNSYGKIRKWRIHNSNIRSEL